MNTKKILKIIGNILFYSIIILMLILTISITKAKKSGGNPDLFGYRLYTVLTESMSPTIKRGSLIIVKESKPEDIKPEDIITFKSETTSNLTTHRVKSIINEGTIKYVTQGDANNNTDPLPVNSDLLLGEVMLHIPYIGATMIFIQENTWILYISLIIFIGIGFIPNSKKE